MTIVDYLQRNYYPRYVNPDLIPTDEVLRNALEIHTDKVLVVMDGIVIKGAAIFLRLDDETFEHLESFDLRRGDVLARLLEQKGNNFHFILLSADSYAVIKCGIRKARALGAKTISWWNPNMTKLHKYKGESCLKQSRSS